MIDLIQVRLANIRATYAIQFERFDGTMETHRLVQRKSEAIKLARSLAKSKDLHGVNRVWVYDTVTELGLESFKVKNVWRPSH